MSISKQMMTVLTRSMMVVAVGGLMACTSAAVPQDRYYRIDVSAPTAGSMLLSGVVEIDRFGAEGLSTGRAIVFADQQSASSLQEYNYDSWMKPPSSMLRHTFVNYLRAANVAKDFVRPEMRAKADWLITGHIHKLETRRGDQPSAVVSIEFSVTDTQTGDVRMVHQYDETVPARDSSVQAAVDGVNQATQNIFMRFVSDLRGS